MELRCIDVIDSSYSTLVSGLRKKNKVEESEEK